MGYDPVLEERMLDRQLRLPIKRLYDVAVVGVGGIGVWVATLTALYGVRKLRLFDRDTVEHENMNRLPLPMSDLGRPKVEALADWLKTIRPDIDIETYHGDVNDHFDGLDGAEQVFICVDNTEANNAVTKVCEEKGLPAIRAAYDGDRITIKHAAQTWTTPGKEGAAGYRVVPSSAHYAALSASLAIEMAVNDKATGVIYSSSAKDLLRDEEA